MKIQRLDTILTDTESAVLFGVKGGFFFRVVSLKCYYVLILPLPSIYRYCIKPRHTYAFLSF